ncbi:AAA family ATPase [Nonomuraea sp. NPDC050786]|uniref:MinD/ParA family ATP-binding protein n=1 Tax=Nonomuraea sp. NPDC050786 TaxID=3154840 RepID=UPI0033FD570B
MARHDREESLEEQLAWLDAIKETEEAPVPVSASTAVPDEPIASPYPQDPWRLVPAQQDTPTPPLFRAAVDSVYGAEAAEDLPDGETEAAEWLGTARAATKEPAAPSVDDDPFHAPLKPLPRPDDTDTYTLSFTPPEAPEQAAGEEEDTSWSTVPEWARAPEPAPEEPEGPAAETEIDAEEEAADEEDDEEAAWADTSPRHERPQWTEPSDTLPAIQPPQWRDRDGSAEDERPQHTEAEERHSWAEPLHREEPAKPSWDEPLQREEPAKPSWSEPPHREEPAKPSWSEPPHREEPAKPSWSEPPHREEPAKPSWAEPLHREEPAHEPERPQQHEWRPAEREIPPPPQRHRRPAPIPVFTAPPRPPVTGRPTADSLDPESLLRGRRNAPSKGWRRLVYKASGGWIKPGEPPEVRRRRELLNRARTPVTAGHHRVAVLSLKGGVGKTTTTVGLGATLASMRGDRVIAVDANPDRGTLSDKLVLETSATVRDLLNERDQVKRYVDIRAFTSQAPSRLEVLASDRDPSVSEAFSGADYQAVSQVLENFYSICITDCGTGLLHSAMGGVLGLADQIVLVSSPSVDGARAASATLDWLEAHHYADLVKNATVVLCSVRPRSKSAVDIKKLEAHFAARCRAVIRVPYDPHLEEGAEIDLDRLQEPTRDAFLQLAAYVGDGFAPR